MYRDNSLIPTEALRLAALGLLAEAPRRYADLARDVRRFVSRLAGPSLDLLVPSLELLKFEGLVQPVDGAGMADNAVFALTQLGQDELKRLLTSNVRPQVTDFNKLVMALKLRFIDQLDEEGRLAQLDLLEDAYAAELARLDDLICNDDDVARGMLRDWVEQERGQLASRLEWVRSKIS